MSARKAATADAAATINSIDLHRFAKLTKKKRELEAELEGTKKELALLEHTLLDQMTETGIPQLKASGFTISIRRQLWAGAKDGDYERATKALTRARLGRFVQKRFNTNTLSAYVRELDRDGKPLPKALDGAIEVVEKFSLSAVKSSR